MLIVQALCNTYVPDIALRIKMVVSEMWVYEGHGLVEADGHSHQLSPLSVRPSISPYVCICLYLSLSVSLYIIVICNVCMGLKHLYFCPVQTLKIELAFRLSGQKLHLLLAKD